MEVLQMVQTTETRGRRSTATTDPRQNDTASGKSYGEELKRGILNNRPQGDESEPLVQERCVRTGIGGAGNIRKSCFLFLLIGQMYFTVH
jgi:hypothetical protein